MDLNSSRRRLSQTTPPPAPSHPPFHARVFRFSVIPLRVEFASHGKEVFPGKELAAEVVPHASWPRVGTRQYWGVKWRLVGFVIRVCPALGSWRPWGTTPRRPDLSVACVQTFGFSDFLLTGYFVKYVANCFVVFETVVHGTF